MRSVDCIIADVQQWLYNDTEDPSIVTVDRRDIEALIKDLHLHAAQRDELFAAVREKRMLMHEIDYE
jgi:hypothetical protein